MSRTSGGAASGSATSGGATSSDATSSGAAVSDNGESEHSVSAQGPPSKARWRHLGGQILRFGMVGVANTLVQQAIYLLLLQVMWYAAAHGVSWCAAIVFAFFAHCRFTYRVAPTWRRFALFPLSALPSFVFSTVGTVVVVQWLGVPKEAASFVASVAAIPASFLIARLVLLSGHHPVEVTAESLAATEPSSASQQP